MNSRRATPILNILADLPEFHDFQANLTNQANLPDKFYRLVHLVSIKSSFKYVCLNHQSNCIVVTSLVYQHKHMNVIIPDVSSGRFAGSSKFAPLLFIEPCFRFELSPTWPTFLNQRYFIINTLKSFNFKTNWFRTPLFIDLSLLMGTTDDHRHIFLYINTLPLDNDMHWMHINHQI